MRLVSGLSFDASTEDDERIYLLLFISFEVSKTGNLFSSNAGIL